MKFQPRYFKIHAEMTELLSGNEISDGGRMNRWFDFYMPHCGGIKKNEKEMQNWATVIDKQIDV
jgi:hypothetical protein